MAFYTFIIYIIYIIDRLYNHDIPITTCLSLYIHDIPIHYQGTNCEVSRDSIPIFSTRPFCPRMCVDPQDHG